MPVVSIKTVKRHYLGEPYTKCNHTFSTNDYNKWDEFQDEVYSQSDCKIKQWIKKLESRCSCYPNYIHHVGMHKQFINWSSQDLTKYFFGQKYKFFSKIFQPRNIFSAKNIFYKNDFFSDKFLFQDLSAKKYIFGQNIYFLPKISK